MHLLIAREAVDQHLAVAGDIIDPEADFGRKTKAGLRAGGFYARWLPTLTVGGGQVPGGYGAYGPLAKHVRYVERSARKLARSTFYGMSRWQGKLEYRQGFLSRIVDIGAELFAMSASCVRAKAQRSTYPEGVELADMFCGQARIRVEELFERLWRNTDVADVAAAKKVLSGSYTRLEEGVMEPPAEGEWVATWKAGPSTEPDVRRRIPHPSV
jgi:hypothetical protein